MATPFNLTRLAVSYALAAAMLAACGGSQMSGSSAGVPAQSASVAHQGTSVLPADEGGGGCGGGDTSHGGFQQADEGRACCGGGDRQGGKLLRNNDEGGHHCKNIRVSPHVIYFTPSNPGPVTVTVKTQQQGTVSELDDCGGASGIATVAQGTGDHWTVTAGAQTGSCKALFILKDSNGKRIGRAVLHITNLL